MKNLKKSAFSLIELSIVILIIGILIAGITQSSRLIRQMKLTAARSLTESSPVASIKGLVLWLETAGEKSFSIEPEDGVNLVNGTRWLDRNPQSSSKADAANIINLDLESLKLPKYIDNCINDLPCLSFDNINREGMEISQKLGTVEGLSIFIVFKTPDEAEDFKSQNLLMTKNLPGLEDGFQIPISNLSVIYFCNSVNGFRYPGVIPSGEVKKNSVYLTSIIDNPASIKINTYYNAQGNMMQSEDENVETTVKNLNEGIYIGWQSGSAENFGYESSIAEIIMFNRALKNEERISVQEYLAKKWGIVVRN